MKPIINKIFSGRKSACVVVLSMRIGFADQPAATSQHWRLLEQAGQSDAGSHPGLHRPSPSIPVRTMQKSDWTINEASKLEGIMLRARGGPGWDLTTNTSLHLASKSQDRNLKFTEHWLKKEVSGNTLMLGVTKTPFPRNLNTKMIRLFSNKLIFPQNKVQNYL